MWKCPVCEETSGSLLCAQCGFDGSRNYEQYPSFGKLPFPPDAISALRRKQMEAKNKYMRCLACGGYQFLVERVSFVPICASCGKKLTPKQMEAPQNIVTVHKQPTVINQTFHGKPPAIPAGGCTVVSTDTDKTTQQELLRWRDIKAIAAGRNCTVRLRTDGAVLITPHSQWGRVAAKWTKITAIASGGYHVVGLRTDGTVLAVGDNDHRECRVNKWTEIKAVSAGLSHTVGLHENGTVLAVGDNSFGQCNTKKWTQITDIAAGTFHTVGLREDGTVISTGISRYRSGDIEKWHHVVAIAAGQGHTVALQANGTVLATGENNLGQCNVAGWTNIVAVAAGGDKTVGLRADGTVVSTDPADPIQNWKRIAAIAVGTNHIVALQLPEEE